MSKASKDDRDKPKAKLELVAIAPPSRPIAEPTQEKDRELEAIAAVPKPKPNLSNKKQSDGGDRKVLPPISPEKLKQREAIARTPVGKGKSTRQGNKGKSDSKERPAPPPPPEGFIFQAIGLIEGTLTKRDEKTFALAIGDGEPCRVAVNKKLRLFLRHQEFPYQAKFLAWPNPRKDGKVYLRLVACNPPDPEIEPGQFRLSGFVIGSKRPTLPIEQRFEQTELFQFVSGMYLFI